MVHVHPGSAVKCLMTLECRTVVELITSPTDSPVGPIRKLRRHHMIAHLSAATQRPGRRLLISLASIALLATGCSNLISTSPVSNEASSPGAIGGRVHGGNQPVAGATVNLYFAGQGTHASGAKLVATTKTADDNAGSFSFTKLPDSDTVNPTTNTFSCPVSGTATPYVYVVARGGNTLNTHDSSVNNTAAVFIAPMGLCNQLTSSTFVYMSEAVTAATVAAVHQYMNVNTGDIGADSILAAYDGLQNAFATVSNLVSLSTGQTLATKPLTGPLSGVTVTASPEQAKLNQVANILSSCVNNASSAASACVTLFANAVPPASASTTSTPTVTFSAATDVLQAAYFMFTNPTDTNATNLTNLYNLSPASGAPYQPTLTAAPSDWSIGVQYVASGTCGTAGTAFLGAPYDINVSQTGDIWVADGLVGNGSLAQISPTGVPMACLPLTGASHGATIDANGNVWVGDSDNNKIYRYTPSNTTPSTLVFPTTTAPFALAADGLGNIYYSTVTAGSASVWVIPNAAPPAIPPAAPVPVTAPIAPIEISTTVGTTPYRILVNGDNSVWASSQNGYVSRIATAAVGSPNYLNGYSTTQFTTPAPSYGLAAENLRGVYVSAQAPSNQVTLLSGSGTSYATGFLTNANAGGLNVPSAVAADGARNVWAANDQPVVAVGSPTATASVVSQFSAAGISLSPNPGATTGGGYQKALPFFLNGRTIAIDEAGNVWVGRDGSQQLTEIVGGAVPIFQPYALGINQNRFQTIP